MNVDLAALPDDVETLQKLVRSLVAERVSLSEAKAEIERLNLIIKKLQRNQYGRRAERLNDDQLQLGFEDLNADLARVETSLPPPPAESRAPRTQSERPSLPAHLTREDVRLDVEHQACPCCGGILQATASPVATEALRRIAELYVIEAAIRGQTADARQSMRRSKSLPLVTAMKAWLEIQLAQIPPRGGLADATRYALSRWDALCCFLNDGRIELDTNTVERAIRPVTLGRKNHPFAGSDEGASYYPSAYLPIIQGISDWHRKATDCGAIACERHLGARLVA